MPLLRRGSYGGSVVAGGGGLVGVGLVTPVGLGSAEEGRRVGRACVAARGVRVSGGGFLVPGGMGGGRGPLELFSRVIVEREGGSREGEGGRASTSAAGKAAGHARRVAAYHSQPLIDLLGWRGFRARGIP